MTKADFLHVLQSEFVEKKIFDLSIEDVIKPMATLARKYGKDLGELFGKIDSSNDGMISAEELADHVKRAVGMILRPEDIQMMKDYFKAKSRSEKINRTDFLKLFSRDFERNYSEPAAKKSLSDIKNRVEELKLDRNRLQDMVQKHNDTKAEFINVANFKRAIHGLKCLDQYSIDNLTKYMDTNNEGFVMISAFISRTFNASLGASFRNTSSKWSK